LVDIAPVVVTVSITIDGCILGTSEGDVVDLEEPLGALEGLSVARTTVIVNISLVERPVASVAVTVTVTSVSPKGNDDPLGWLSVMVGLGSQSSPAVAKKVTIAEVSINLSVDTTRFHGRTLPLTSGIGGATSVEVNQPVAAGYKLPHPSDRTHVLPARRVYCTGTSHTVR
jgi:hypothetical protein